MTAAVPSLPGAASTPDHGTRARYVCGCRCSDCRAANTRAYHERYEMGRELASEIAPSADGYCPGVDGEPCRHRTKLRRDSHTVCRRCLDRLAWNGLVDAREARKHLRMLSRRGVGYKAVADASDVGKSTVLAVRSGQKRRIRKRSAAAILAVDVGAVADHGFVPAGPTWQMLRDLEREYLSMAGVARALGYGTGKIQIGRKRVLAKTEMRVRRLYEQAIGRWEGMER